MSTVLALYCPQGLAQVDWQGPKFTERWHHLNYFGICIRVLFWQNTIAFCCCTIGNVCGHLADVCTLTFFRTWHYTKQMLKNALPTVLLSPSEVQICPSPTSNWRAITSGANNLCYGRTCLHPACVWTVVRSHASDAIVRHQPFKSIYIRKNILLLAVEQVVIHLMLTPLWILVSQSETQKPDIQYCWHDLIVHSESTSALYVTLVAVGCSEGWYASY